MSRGVVIGFIVAGSILIIIGLLFIWWAITVYRNKIHAVRNSKYLTFMQTYGHWFLWPLSFMALVIGIAFSFASLMIKEKRKPMFKNINAQTGWKQYSYHQDKKELYLIAWLSKRIEIIENIDEESYKEFERAVNKHSKEKITLWINKTQDKQGMKIEQTTKELINSGEYNIPINILKGIDYHVYKNTIKLNNWQEISQVSLLKRKKLLKEKLEDIRKES